MDTNVYKDPPAIPQRRWGRALFAVYFHDSQLKLWYAWITCRDMPPIKNPRIVQPIAFNAGKIFALDVLGEIRFWWKVAAACTWNWLCMLSCETSAPKLSCISSNFHWSRCSAHEYRQVDAWNEHATYLASFRDRLALWYLHHRMRLLRFLLFTRHYVAVILSILRCPGMSVRVFYKLWQLVIVKFMRG